MEAVVGDATAPGATVEWGRYTGVTAMGRRHATVCHQVDEWS
jgi:hypothetical protein